MITLGHHQLLMNRSGPLPPGPPAPSAFLVGATLSSPTVIMWETGGWTRTPNITTSTAGARTALITPDDRYVIYCTQGASGWQARVFDLVSFTQVSATALGGDMYVSFPVSGGSKYFLAGRGSVTTSRMYSVDHGAWSVNSLGIDIGQRWAGASLFNAGPVYAGGDHYVVSGVRTNFATLNNGTLSLASRSAIINTGVTIYALSVSADGSRIAIATTGGTGETIVGVINASTKSLIHSVVNAKSSQASVAYSPNGQWLAVTYNNTNIVIWDAVSHATVATLALSTASCLTWSNDSAYLACASLSGAETITVYSSATWTPVAASLPAVGIRSLYFSRYE